MAFEELDIREVKDNEHDDLASRIETYYKQDMADKLLRAYVWDEAIRFVDGDQHIEYNVSTNRFQQVSITRNNDYIPRPITNFILPTVRTVISQLTKQKPEAIVRPNSNDPRDVAAGKVADLILDVKYEELREEEKQQEKCSWGVCCGTVFKKVFWNESTNKVLRIPKVENIKRNALGEDGSNIPELDNFGNQMTDSTGNPIYQQEEVEQPVLDELGNPVNDEIQIGDVDTAVIPPFNIAMPLQTRSPLELTWIMEYSIQTVDWIKEQYDQDGDGYTGEAKELTEEKDLNTVLQIEYRLRTLVGRRSGGHYSTGSSGYIDIKNSAVLKEFYSKPNKDYPKGRMVVVANSRTLYAGDNPYYVEGHDDSWNPYVEWRFDIIPGRAWGKSLVDELIPINRRINSIDALIILNRKTMAIPQWLIPNGCGVPNGYINGRPGLNILYNPVGANGAKPEKVQPSPLPQQIYDERSQAVDDLKALGMTNQVLEGENPTGVKTAYQLEQLQENALANFGSTFQRWEKSFEREQTKILLLISQRYKEPRPEFGKKLRAINKDITDIELEMFLGEDLRDNVNVRVENGSSIPRSRAGENAVLREAIQNQLLNLDNPVSKNEIYARLGLKGIDYEKSPDIKRAQWENSIIEQGDINNLVVTPSQPLPQQLVIDPMSGQPVIDPMTGQPQMQGGGMIPPATVLELDDDITHIIIHSARIKDPNVPAETRQKYLVHIEEHLQHQAAGAQAAGQVGATPIGAEQTAGQSRQNSASAKTETGGL